MTIAFWILPIYLTKLVYFTKTATIKHLRAKTFLFTFLKTYLFYHALVLINYTRFRSKIIKQNFLITIAAKYISTILTFK